MAGAEALIKGLISRFLPQQRQENDRDGMPVRASLYGDQHVLPIFTKQHGLGDEGSSYCLAGTPGTGIATIAALTSLVDTSPFIIVQNIATTASKMRAYLDMLKLICTAAGTAGTALRYAVKVGPSRTAPTGADSAFNGATPQNTNADDSRASIVRVYAGALVAPAAQAGTRLLGAGLLKSAIPVANDQYVLNFGANDPSAPATQVDRHDAHPPVIIGPGQSAFIHIWLPSQSAASSYEVQLHLHER
jgi:hypothetical protein